MKKIKQFVERSDHALQKLRDILLARMPEEGVFNTPVAGIGMARRNEAGVVEHRFDQPLVSLLVQGEKETVIGGEVYRLVPGDILTVCVDMPSSSVITAATREHPLLTFFILLDTQIIRSLLLEMHMPETQEASNGVSAGQADRELAEAFLRLANLLDNPGQAAIRSRFILMDIHYLLLCGRQGDALRNLYGGNRYGKEVFAAIAYLKSRLDRNVAMAELGDAVNMSASSLYRHFKAVTGLSPMQYHKLQRLHEARRLILNSHERASAAAYKTGYESVSQFSREYRKLFGISPAKSHKRD